MDVLELLMDSCDEIKLDEVTTVRPQKCSNFDDLINIYNEDLLVSDSFADCAAISFATHISIQTTGDPLWYYIVGPPSCGKTTLLELVGSDEIHSLPLSKFTGIMSGMAGEGNHLIPLMNGKCTIIKDGTLLLELSQQQLANIHGELRDIFDGSLEAHYRNGVYASFKGVTFSMLIGITERIYGLNMAALGERFLHCRLESSRESALIRNRRAMDNVLDGMTVIDREGSQDATRAFPRQRAYTAGFLGHMHSQLTTQPLKRFRLHEDDADLIQAQADVIACSRAESPRDDRKNEILYESRPEDSTRVVKQLVRTGYFLTYVFNTDNFNEKIRGLLSKVTSDTAHSRQSRIIDCVAHAENPLMRNQIANMTGIPLETISRKIEDLIQMKIFREVEHGKLRPAQGRGIPFIECTPWVKDSFRKVRAYNNARPYQERKNSSPIWTPPSPAKFPPRPKR